MLLFGAKVGEVSFKPIEPVLAFLDRYAVVTLFDSDKSILLQATNIFDGKMRDGFIDASSAALKLIESFTEVSI